VREKYPEGRAKERSAQPDIDCIRNLCNEAKKGDTLKKLLNPHMRKFA